jgi:hypothetical protein
MSSTAGTITLADDLHRRPSAAASEDSTAQSLDWFKNRMGAEELRRKQGAAPT